jgi:tRNA 2-thiouridine synthesizing protein A
MQTVDVRGQKCPVPIIETKKALREVQAGDSFKVMTDRQPSFNNLTRYLKDNKIQFSSAESDGVWTLTIIKPG